tara:strand:- start:6317 stop:8443 length:2127 start_codon:yes stop_codon:yes gene_type:complete
MRTFLAVFCLLLFTVSIFVFHEQSVYAEEVITVKSTALDTSSILELENNRGNDFNINSVRIWLSEDNSFKSFKTEKGWTGKFEVGGKVIVFSPQTSIKPGESVKFGIKTNSENPIINWKALDSAGQVIQSAATATKQSDTERIPQITQTKIVAINDNSYFKFIPEKPSVGSDFRIIGENFIPNQNIKLYIGNQMIKTINIDGDGKFISTATVPDNLSVERTDFVLRDSGGTEKNVSMRLSDTQNRHMSSDLKISIDFTPKTVKRGDTIQLTGSATPDTTLTITSTNKNNKILNISTISTGFDGKWTFDNLFTTDLALGKITIKITDGKSTVIRNFDVISSQLINISSLQTRYEVGDTIKFAGSGIPNNEISLIVEDPIGIEVFSESFKVSSSGDIVFEVDTIVGFTEGTYILHAYQGSESAVSVVGVGVQPQEVLLVSSGQMNYSAGSDIDLIIRGEPHKAVSVVVIDESDKQKISDSIELDDNGNYIYFVESNELGTGAFTVEVRHGVSRGSTVFTIGLSTGTGLIEFQTIKDEYVLGDQILIIGKTGNSVILTVSIIDPSGSVIREFDTFSDRIGTFTVDNFKIPSNGKTGNWIVKIGNEENFVEKSFNVVELTDTIQVNLDKDDRIYRGGDMIAISGKNASIGSSVTVSITDLNGTKVTTNLFISITSTGEFYTIWQLPKNIEPGIYDISVNDSVTDASISFTVN